MDEMHLSQEDLDNLPEYSSVVDRDGDVYKKSPSDQYPDSDWIIAVPLIEHETMENTVRQNRRSSRFITTFSPVKLIRSGHPTHENGKKWAKGLDPDRQGETAAPTQTAAQAVTRESIRGLVDSAFRDWDGETKQQTFVADTVTAVLGAWLSLPEEDLSSGFYPGRSVDIQELGRLMESRSNTSNLEVRAELDAKVMDVTNTIVRKDKEWKRRRAAAGVS